MKDIECPYCHSIQDEPVTNIKIRALIVTECEECEKEFILRTPKEIKIQKIEDYAKKK